MLLVDVGEYADALSLLTCQFGSLHSDFITYIELLIDEVLLTALIVIVVIF